MGGPMGGSMGGARMPIGFGGPTSSFYTRMAPPIYLGASRFRGVSTGGTWSERTAHLAAARSTEYLIQRSRHGAIKGTIIAFRGLHLGGLRYEASKVKLERAKKELDSKKISQRTYNKRCLGIHKRYYSYLARIGYMYEDEYQNAMEKISEALGFDYVYNPETSPSRSR